VDKCINFGEFMCMLALLIRLSATPKGKIPFGLDPLLAVFRFPARTMPPASPTKNPGDE